MAMASFGYFDYLFGTFVIGYEFVGAFWSKGASDFVGGEYS